MHPFLTADTLNNRSCHFVENDQSFFAVLYSLLRDQEYRCCKFRNINFPFSAKTADFLLAASGVDFEKRHAGQMVRKLFKQSRLLIPG